MIDDKWLDRCLFYVCIAYANTAGVERHFTARLIDFSDCELLFEDAQGMVTTEPRQKITKIMQLNSERYGNYNYSSMH